MCAAKSTVYRFWKLETYGLENHSFPENDDVVDDVVDDVLVKNQDRGRGRGEDGWGGEGRECSIFPKYF